MALMFTRIARNFIRNGYFPTDEVTLARILSALAPASDRPAWILDPCCGEGTALAEVKHHLTEAGGSPTAFGIEYDEARAWHAKTLLDRCIHADLNDCTVSLRQFALLFLNPPYGDLVSDSERAMSAKEGGRKRLEKAFAERTLPMLQPGGVLVLIVPYTVLDKEFGALVSRNCERVTVYAAPEQQFRQAVIFGVKRTRVREPDKAVVELFTKVRENRYRASDGEWREGFVRERVLPEQWSEAPYLVPAGVQGKEPSMQSVRIDAKQLRAEIAASPLLWDRFGMLFRSSVEAPRRPLRQLSPWHLSLMLAAGQVSGVVRSEAGRVLLVKGDTYKAKAKRTSSSFNEETGVVTTTRTETDRFVPLIRALDCTRGSETFGRVLSIE